MKKFLWTITIVLSLLMLVFLIGAGMFAVKWYSTTQEKSVPEVTETVFPKDKIVIGERIPCTFKVKTSWSLMPVSAALSLTEGLQEGKSPEITPGKWMWGTRIWNVTVYVQPFRDGKYAEIPVRILCEGGPDGKAEASAVIPAFNVEQAEISNMKKLEIADKVSGKNAEENKNWIWYVSGAGILLLILVLWLILRHKKLKTTPQEPVWIIAINRIGDLRKTLHERKITPENAIIRLTDVVRHYLEKQFSLRAERQTTPEFLETLRKDNGPLDVEQRRFLREFLSSADMVKFARISADETLFENAAERAESLIRNTIQDPEQKENRS